MEPIVVAPGVVVPASAVKMSAARSGGPGGQNVNKVSTKVELRVTLQEIDGLTEPQFRRLTARVRNRLDDEGALLVVSQLTRSQAQNLEDAREKVRALVAESLVAPRRRVPTRPSRAAKARRIADKKRNSTKKSERRWTDE